jgi:hypothetical protein
MQPRTLVQGIAFLRAGIGVAMVAAPARGARGWVGEAGTTPGAQVIGIALGARDLAVGLGTLNALHRDQDVKSWVAASALCDAADAFASISRRNDIPTTGAVGVTALATSAAAVGVYLLAKL